MNRYVIDDDDDDDEDYSSSGLEQSPANNSSNADHSSEDTSNARAVNEREVIFEIDDDWDNRSCLKGCK